MLVFDFRKSYDDAAERLAELVGCVRKIYPSAEVDLLTHSAGGLIARRYLLDHPDAPHVNRLVTIGAPWLGAPKLSNTLLTGDFIDLIAEGPDLRSPCSPRLGRTHSSRPGCITQ